MRPVKSYNSIPHGYVRKSPIARPSSADDAAATVVTPVGKHIPQVHIPQVHSSQQQYSQQYDAKTVAIQTAKSVLMPEKGPKVEIEPFIPTIMQFIQSLSLAAQQRFVDNRAPAQKSHHTVKRFLVIVDISAVRYFDYELKRACSEIRLICPDVVDHMHIIKFSIVNSTRGNVLNVITLERTCTTRLGESYEFSTVVKILHREIQRIPDDQRNIMKMIGCSPSLSCSYLRIYDPITYANMVFCESVGHVINICFGINYISYRAQMYRDAWIESVAKLVVSSAIIAYTTGVQALLKTRFPGLDIIAILRDPRFEQITNLRFNPWLCTFETLPENARCISLFNNEQCRNLKLPSMNYCSAHACDVCTYQCRHIGGIHGTILILKK